MASEKLYLPVSSANQATTSIEIGKYDPIYKMTYPQLGEQSRYLHKSQGMGSDIPAAPRQIHLDLKQSAVDTKSESDLLQVYLTILLIGLKNSHAQLQN